MTNAVICVEDLFDSLDREEEPEKVRRPIISENRAVRQLLEGLEQILEQYNDMSDLDYGKLIRYCNIVYKNATRSVTLSQPLLQQFLFESKQHEQQEIFREVLGDYVTNCIKDLPEEMIRLDFSHFERPIDFVGSDIYGKDMQIIGDLGCAVFQRIENCNLTIEGDVDFRAVASAKNSRIRIHGFAGSGLGEGLSEGSMIYIAGNVMGWPGSNMKGGVIYIGGDAKDSVGLSMRGGKIHVNGNAGLGTGSLMDDGIIHVDGDIGEDIGSYMTRGTIYHKGRQIVKDGRRLE